MSALYLASEVLGRTRLWWQGMDMPQWGPRESAQPFSVVQLGALCRFAASRPGVRLVLLDGHREWEINPLPLSRLLPASKMPVRACKQPRKGRFSCAGSARSG